MRNEPERRPNRVTLAAALAFAPRESYLPPSDAQRACPPWRGHLSRRRPAARSYPPVLRRAPPARNGSCRATRSRVRRPGRGRGGWRLMWLAGHGFFAIAAAFATPTVPCDRRALSRVGRDVPVQPPAGWRRSRIGHRAEAAGVGAPAPAPPRRLRGPGYSACVCGSVMPKPRRRDAGTPSRLLLRKMPRQTRLRAPWRRSRPASGRCAGACPGRSLRPWCGRSPPRPTAGRRPRPFGAPFGPTPQRAAPVPSARCPGRWNDLADAEPGRGPPGAAGAHALARVAPHARAPRTADAP